MSKAWIAWLVATALLTGCRKVPELLSVEEAADRKDFTVTVQGVGLEKIRVTVSSPHRTTVVIPAGTLFTSRDPATQSMSAASTVRLAFPGPGGVTQQTVELPVYCTNRFLAVPTQASSFGVSIPPETDPVRRLEECLERQAAKHEVKQLAVWMLSDGLLDSSSAEVTARLRDYYLKDTLERLDEDAGSMMASFREMFPDFADVPDSDIVDLIRSKAGDFAEQQAADEIAAYRTHARPLLEACGIDVAGSRFFRVEEARWEPSR